MVFYTDLDNTMIYSYKHDIGKTKRNVEKYQGREVSFVTEKTQELLRKLREKVLIVPISTRTIEQYNRIELGVGNFKYALVCNGGVLLVDGARDGDWYEQSLKMVRSACNELHKAMVLLENDPRRKFEIRFIEKMFVFTKCIEPEKVIDFLKSKLNTSIVDVFNNGGKVYVVPKSLSKGEALLRFRDYIKDLYAVAAGDSEFDISMLKAADEGLAPFGFSSSFDIKFKVREAGKMDIFSEYALSECLKIADEKSTADRNDNFYPSF